MKNLKKLFAVLAAIMMVLTLGTTAVKADDNKQTITITDAKEGHTFNGYQLFKGDIVTDDNGAAVAKSLENIEWGDGFNPTELVAALKADAQIGKRFKDETADPALDLNSAAEIAKAMEGMSAADIDALCKILESKKLAAKKHTATYADGVYTIANLDPGMYFVSDETTGLDEKQDSKSNFILQVAEGENEVKVKNTVPSFEKKVKENNKADNLTKAQDVTGVDYETGYNDVADYSVGELVPFKLYANIPDMSDYKSYDVAFSDTMSNGLTLDQSTFEVYVNGTKVASDKYTATLSDHGFTLTMDLKTYNKTKKESTLVFGENTNTGKGKEEVDIVVAYKALLSGAEVVIGNDGNLNTAGFKFTNNPQQEDNGDPKGQTPDDEVVVFTYELDVTKFDEKDKKVLKDAEFVFYREYKDADNNTVTEYIKSNEGKTLVWTTNKDEAKKFVTGEDGQFKIQGLDDNSKGTPKYYIQETKAPTGYTLVDVPVEVKITATTNNGHNGIDNALTAITLDVTGNSKTTPVDYDNDTFKDGEGEDAADIQLEADPQFGRVDAKVANTSGAVLPETGGMGTTIFYTVGGLLVIGAIIMLIQKRRMAE